MDKWLWAARFFKTRALARRACELGRIECNGQGARAAREVQAGDVLQVKNDGGDFQVEVLALSEMRGPAAVAQTLYRETEASRELRLKLAEERKAMLHLETLPEGKPSKRDRREIDRLRGIAAGLGLEAKVHFTGSIEQVRLPLYYSAADVTVIPSYYESFGLVSLESLACGTPVIASDVGDMRNIINPGITGYVFNGGVEELTEKLESVLGWRRSNHSYEAVRSSVLRFSWGKVTQQIELECRRLIAEYASVTV